MHRMHISLAASLVLCGCGGAYDSTVNGIVKLDGSALTQGQVSFAPQAAGPAAYGIIESNGAYSLKTGREEGLPPGEYTVTVASNEIKQGRSQEGGPLPPVKSITPDWYRDPATSGLSYTVEPGDNEIDLELKSTPPPGWKPPRGRR
jgi:hypothetical protein